MAIRSGDLFCIGYGAKRFTAPLTERGYVWFVNLRPDKVRPGSWVCDECLTRVTPAQFIKHAKQH